MSAWTMAEAKKDFERGLLYRFDAISFGDGEGWAMRLHCSLSMNPVDYLIDAHQKKVRRFKTLDALVSAAQQIGFEVKVLELGKSYS